MPQPQAKHQAVPSEEDLMRDAQIGALVIQQPSEQQQAALAAAQQLAAAQGRQEIAPIQIASQQAEHDPYQRGGEFGPTQMWGNVADQGITPTVAPVPSQLLCPTQPVIHTQTEQIPGPAYPGAAVMLGTLTPLPPGQSPTSPTAPMAQTASPTGTMK